MLAEFQLWLRKPREAETALVKSIRHGEKAVELARDRPLVKHNLEVALQMLDRLREQAHQADIDRLIAAERFADAFDLCAKGVEEQDEQFRAGKDRDSARRRLAYRLDRFAWLLAHCPDGRGRDTKAAVKRARRAVDLQSDAGDYKYTLAMVQYRNGDWRDSLASLDQLKAQEGAWDASGWLLIAMNR